MEHGLPLLDALASERDIALLNVGTWHGTNEGYYTHMLTQVTCKGKIVSES